MEIIKELTDNYGGHAPNNMLIKEMEDRYNMNKEKTEEIVRVLKRQGLIFEPSTGYYKVAWILFSILLKYSYLMRF